MKNDVDERVRSWLFRGIPGAHPYPAAIEHARRSGAADVHLDQLLTGGVSSAAEGWRWEWNQAISVFDALVDGLRNEQSLQAQMVVYVNPFDHMLHAYDLRQLLAHASADPPNLYVVRGDWYGVRDEELHRYPLGNSFFTRGREGKLLCYEVSRPAHSMDDPSEFYGAIIAYWFPEP
jgi:hypothetical protein